VFECVLRRIEERLVGGEGFAVDASLIKADANRQKGIEGDKGLSPAAAGRAIDDYLAVVDDAAFGAVKSPRSSCRRPTRRRAGPLCLRGSCEQTFRWSIRWRLRATA
jgi:hypothetical protein